MTQQRTKPFFVELLAAVPLLPGSFKQGSAFSQSSEQAVNNAPSSASMLAHQSYSGSERLRHQVALASAKVSGQYSARSDQTPIPTLNKVHRIAHEPTGVKKVGAHVKAVVAKVVDVKNRVKKVNRLYYGHASSSVAPGQTLQAKADHTPDTAVTSELGVASCDASAGRTQVSASRTSATQQARSRQTRRAPQSVKRRSGSRSVARRRRAWTPTPTPAALQESANEIDQSMLEIRSERHALRRKANAESKCGREQPHVEPLMPNSNTGDYQEAFSVPVYFTQEATDPACSEPAGVTDDGFDRSRLVSDCREGTPTRWYGPEQSARQQQQPSVRQTVRISTGSNYNMHKRRQSSQGRPYQHPQALSPDDLNLNGHHGLMPLEEGPSYQGRNDASVTREGVHEGHAAGMFTAAAPATNSGVHYPRSRAVSASPVRPAQARGRRRRARRSRLIIPKQVFYVALIAVVSGAVLWQETEYGYVGELVSYVQAQGGFAIVVSDLWSSLWR